MIPIWDRLDDRTRDLWGRVTFTVAVVSLVFLAIDELDDA